MKVQFAPSATGEFHMGSLRTYLANWLWARQQDGVVLLRFDSYTFDPVGVLCLQYAMEVLHWLAVEPDEIAFMALPTREYGEVPELAGLFARIPDLLASSYLCDCPCSSAEKEDLLAYVYNLPHCACPSRVERLGPTMSMATAADASWRLRHPEAPPPVYVVRLHVASLESLATPWGTPLLLGCANPRIGSVVDDMFWIDASLSVLALDLLGRATHILRGRDIAPLQAASQQLARVTGQVLPSTMIIPLVCDPQGKKVDKSRGDRGVLDLRDHGFAPQAVLNNVFRSLNPGVGGTELSHEEMILAFEVDQIPAQDVRLTVSGLIEEPPIP